MKNELRRLRMEVKADIELLSIRCGDMAKNMAGLARQVNINTGHLDSVSGRLKEHDRQINGVLIELGHVGNTMQGLGNTVQGLGNTVQGLVDAVQRSVQVVDTLAREFHQTTARIDESIVGLKASNAEVADMAREAVNGFEWMDDCYKSLAAKMDHYLEALEEEEHQDLPALVRDLLERVERLEQRLDPPAA